MVSDRGWGPYFGSDSPDQAQEAITSAHSLDFNLTICGALKWGRSAGRRRTLSVSIKLLLSPAPAMSSKASHTELEMMTPGNWNRLGCKYMYMLAAVPLFFCNVLPEYFQSTSRVLQEKII